MSNKQVHLRFFPNLALWQRNLWTIFVVEILAIMSFQAGFILIPYYIQEMGIVDLSAVGVWTGAFQSVGAIGFAISTPIWGALGDRYGRKIMLVRAMIATSIVMGLTGMVRSPSQLLLVRAVQGFFTGTPTAASALVAAGTPQDRLAFGLGMVQTSLFIGSSLGPMVGGYIADAFGYRAIFYASALVVLLCFFVTLFLVQEPLESRAAAEGARREPTWQAFKSLLSSPVILLLISLSLVVNLTYGLLGPVIPILIQQLVAMPDRLASTAGTISGVAAFSAALAALVIGRLSDVIGHRRVVLACALGMGLFYMPQAFASSTMVLGVLRAVQGLFQGGIAPSASALLVSKASKGKAGTALGLSTSASGIGFAIGPMMGALLLATASIRIVFFIAATAFFLVAAALVLIGQKEKADQIVELQEDHVTAGS